MKDRLGELQPYGTFDQAAAEQTEKEYVSLDVQIPFQNETMEIKEGMSKMRANFKLLRDAFNKELLDPGTKRQMAPDQQSQSDVDELLKNTNAIANRIRWRLKEFKELVVKLDPQDPNKRQLYSTQTTLTKKFMDLMNEYQSLQTGFKTKFRQKIVRQAEIVMPGITENEVDQMIASGQAEQMFANKILEEKHAEARSALMLLQEQRHDLQQLEMSISELNSLFLDVTTLLDAQGDALSNIAKSTADAAGATAVARKHVEVAEKLVRKRRRKCIVVISAVVGVILIIVALAAARAMS
eukprot:TRINITY_DN6893_c0_g1_i1.p1 TRINITY_DN6893_c0_g1~~TRINITY_DN6893_c0_g1_i1.p1  ORF type:complete len:297 (-),score=80.60 TRINITY_DN6893_c0_g1_i1:223-1113(-)